MNLDNEKVINCLSKVKNMIEALMNTEKNILLFIQDVIRSPIMTPFFIVVTKLGNGGAIWIVIAVMLLFSKKKRRYGYMIMLSLLGSLLLNNLLLKNLVGRMRPYEIIGNLIPLIENPIDYAFPSGHTASSFAAAAILYRKLPKRFGVPALILATLIGFSRLYLGVHYPSDVLYGMVSGVVISYIAEVVMNKVFDHWGEKNDNEFDGHEV